MVVVVVVVMELDTGKAANSQHGGPKTRRPGATAEGTGSTSMPRPIPRARCPRRYSRPGTIDNEQKYGYIVVDGSVRKER